MTRTSLGIRTSLCHIGPPPVISTNNGIFFRVIFAKYATCDIFPDLTRYYLLKSRNIT